MMRIPTFIRAALLAGGVMLAMTGTQANAQKLIFIPHGPNAILPPDVPIPVTRPVTRPPNIVPPTMIPRPTPGPHVLGTTRTMKPNMMGTMGTGMSTTNPNMMSTQAMLMQTAVPTMNMRIPMNSTFLLNQLTQQAMLNQLSQLAMMNSQTAQAIGSAMMPQVSVIPFVNPYLYGGYGAMGSYANPNSYANPPSYATAPSYAPPATIAPEVVPEDRQRRLEQVALDRAVNNPAVNEVTSGTALNTILSDLKKMASKLGWDQLPSAAVDMPADMLVNLHVTRSGNSNVGILKKWDRMNWPAALSGPEFKLQREQIDNLLEAAIGEAKADGRANPETIQQLSGSVSSFQQQLRDNTVNLTIDKHMEAKTFLNNLEAGVAALQQPDAESFLNGKFQVKAQTIPELVKWMTDNGLQFAPAMPGDEAAYTTLRERLASYDRTLRARDVADRPKTDSKVVP